MSTKTNFKRVALVAVAALGLGVLTSVAPASATDIAAANVTLSDVGGTAGVCAPGASTVASTPRTITVGGTQDITIDTNADGVATITGGAVWVSGSATDAIDSTRKVLTLNATGTNRLSVVSPGVFSVAYTTDAGVAVETHYFSAVASCNNAWSSSKSKAQLNLTAGASATSNVDATGAATIAYTSGGQYSYLDIILKDAYDVALDTSLTAKIATVTGGCTVNWTTSATSGTTTAVDPAASADNTEDLVIIGDNTPRVCTVTVDFGGTVVASKTVKMFGDVAKLTIDKASTSTYFAYGVDGSASATAVGADALTYVATDSAGNTINLPTAPTITGGTAGFQQATFGDGGYASTTATTYGFATLDFIGTNVTIRGKGTYAIKVSRLSDGVTVTSETQSAEINKSTYTYTASFDKASYVSGDIMTLTISAKDSAGNPVYDGYTIGTNTIGVGGTTALSTIATTDAFVNGVVKYKYSAGATASGYGWTVGITNGSLQSPLTGTILITQPAGGVSNADVLKAIVSLIASINKQIAALQKALLKK